MMTLRCHLQTCQSNRGLMYYIIWLHHENIAICTTVTTSECSELLNPMRASCWISAQH